MPLPWDGIDCRTTKQGVSKIQVFSQYGRWAGKVACQLAQKPRATLIESGSHGVEVYLLFGTEPVFAQRQTWFSKRKVCVNDSIKVTGVPTIRPKKAVDNSNW
ncbi:hypothetical protein CWM47_08430 [Spirosoma pollinicola]|uniref:Uncharacterized protein n=1 Tax=Spirosoma pollinicola TaxID=2057025 RepID=A0A2K8YW65_9BACT|nr:hypothetical protein CWM47_08430 [Spirosoma pollinicola]